MARLSLAGMAVVAYGVNHRTAPLELRERLALDEAAVTRALAALAAGHVSQELAILSTCNRTEICAVLDDRAGDVAAAAHDLFRRATGVHDLAPAYTYLATGADAGLHLMRVAAGLDSQVVGEHQILGQVRSAYLLAQRAGTLGPVLDRLFTSALHAAGRVHAETQVGAGAASVASAGIVLGERMLGLLTGRRALVVGAGETGTLVARHLAKRDLAAIYLANRTAAAADTLAARVRGRAVPFDAVPALLADVDLVVCATGAGRHVVTAGMARAARPERDTRPLVLVDLAMPRNINPAAAGGAVVVYALDALHAVVRDSVAQRQREATHAEAILSGEAAAFAAWLRGRSAVPLIRDLHAHFERLRAEEVGRAAKHCPPDEQARIDHITRSLVRRLLQAPTVRLTTADPDAASSLCWADAVRGLFAMPAPVPGAKDPRG